MAGDVVHTLVMDERDPFSTTFVELMRLEEADCAATVRDVSGGRRVGALSVRKIEAAKSILMGFSKSMQQEWSGRAPPPAPLIDLVRGDPIAEGCSAMYTLVEASEGTRTADASDHQPTSDGWQE